MQRDLQLTFRMAISFLALTLIYLAFLGFIAMYFGFGILPISMIAGVMIGAQWFFSTHPPITERVKRLMQIEQELRDSDKLGI
jgi:hypothetical protein